MFYAFVADVIVAVHLAYVTFVVVGLLLILVGLLAKWSWVRNPWFRWAHLLAIGIVSLEAVYEIECPLTGWERELRELAEQTTDGGTFMGRLIHNVFIYDELPHDHWVFTASYIGVGVLILALFVFAPPRRHKAPPAAGGSEPPENL